MPQTLNPACDIPDTIPPRPTWLKRKPTRTTEAAERAARKYNVNPADVLSLMPEALALIRREAETIALARQRGRQLTGLDARIIAIRENKYLDHSTAVRFDETARELAAEFPALCLDPDGHDTPARVWAFIAEGKQSIPCRHSDCVAELAAQWCEQLETEDFPDDADGFDPSSLDETTTPSEISDHNPASYIQGTPCSQPQFTLLLAVTSRPSTANGMTAGSSCLTTGYSADSPNATNLPPSITLSPHDSRNATRRLSATISEAGDTDGDHPASTSGRTVATAERSKEWPRYSNCNSEEEQHADENPSRHVPMPTSRDRPSCRGRSRRETPRPLAGGRTLPGVQFVCVAIPLVRPHRTGRGTGGSSRATPRLNRVTEYNPAYVAGNGLLSSIRARDGPAMIRYPVSGV